MRRRVVVTDGRAITPIGRSKSEITHHLRHGKSGIKKMREDDVLYPYLRSRVFGGIDYPIENDFKRSQKKSLSNVGLYACTLAKEIIESSGLDQEFISSGRMGVAFGSTHGSPLVERNMFRDLFNGDFHPGMVDPNNYLKTLTHTTAVNIASIFNITGRVLSSCTACTTSSQSVGFGYEAIQYGLQDVMLCGGADEYDTLAMMIFDRLLAASVNFNDTPERTPRPFDVDRDGLVVSEGGGALLLEEYEFAKKRGANIMAEVIGFSSSCNGGNLVNPTADGVRRTIESGLENAQIDSGDVDFVSAHATSTKVSDIIESQAIYEVYKDVPYVSAFKSYVGHMMSSCGVVESIMVLYMMEDSVIYPTLNLENIDEKCSMINHTLNIRERDIQIASVQNFAFGGVNTALFYKKI